MYVGVIFYQFSRIRMLSQTSSIDLTEEQKEWAEMCKSVLRMQPLKVLPPPKQLWRKLPFSIISHRYFDPGIMVAIIGSVLVMATSRHDESAEETEAKENVNVAFTAVFIAECGLKIAAMGFREYWSSNWNKFDFFIVCSSIVDLCVGFLSTSFARLIRLFRLSRMFRLIKSLKGLKSLFETLIVSLPAFWNVGALVLLLFFIYSYLGVWTFGKTIRGDSLNEHANFETFQMAMLTLFRVATNDEWVGLMRDCSVTPGSSRCTLADENCGSWSAYPFFISFVVIVSMIMLNLFTAVIIENFENMQDHEEWKLSPNVLEGYVESFREFDDGSGTIAGLDLERLLRNIPPPLGLGHGTSRVISVHFIKSLNVPLTSDCRVPFRRTAFELVRRVCECDMPPGEMRDRIEYGIRKAFPDIWVPIPDELSWSALMCVIRVQRHWRELTANRLRRRLRAEAEAAAAAAAGAKNVDAIGTVVVKFESPPAPDPLRVSPYYAGDASVDSSAAPGTLYYEKTAIEASNAVDAIDRRVNNDAVVSGAAGAIGAAAASSSFLYSLFRDPSVGPYLLQTWGYLNGLLSPAGGGRP